METDLKDLDRRWDTAREELINATTDLNIRLVRRKSDHPTARKLILAIKRQIGIPKSPGIGVARNSQRTGSPARR